MINTILNNLQFDFLNKQYSIIPSNFYSDIVHSLQIKYPFNIICDRYNNDQCNKMLFFSHQTHGCDYLVVSSKIVLNVPSFSYIADILITDQENIILGVVTADCLPIIIYDIKKRVVAIVHAGWKGAVAGVFIKAVDILQKEFFSSVLDLYIIIGPSAGRCCYVVDQRFVDNLTKDTITLESIIYNEGKLYFDLVTYITLQAISIGIMSLHINHDYVRCTICNDCYCSYRRSCGAPDRQISLVSLKSFS